MIAGFSRRKNNKNTGNSETLGQLCDAIKPVLKIDECDGMTSSLGTHITVPTEWVASDGTLNGYGRAWLNDPEIDWYVSILYSDYNCWEEAPYLLMSASPQ